MELIPIREWTLVDPDGIAVEASGKSKEKFKLGAIICDKKGRVVATGYNRHKTHPLYGSGNFKMVHAEGAALMAADRLEIDVAGMTMYIFRHRGHLSKPCKDCQELLKKYKIKKVFYSTRA